MKKYTIFIIITISILTSSFINSFAGNSFRRPYTYGSYFEYVYSTQGITERYTGKVVKDTLIDGLYYSTLFIQGEPPLSDYYITYAFDTTSNKLYEAGGMCSEFGNYSLIAGFNLPPGYVWNTCHDTLGGIYFKSEIIDNKSVSGILQSGTELVVLTSFDTVGTPVDIRTDYQYSELFGFVSLYASSGSAFGGPYSKNLGGAVINGVTYGTILLGINQLSNEIPVKISLSQNYPNPFNPTTKINFSILRSGFVKLSLYDQLGREIRQLVNESLDAGSFEYTLNASNLPSGIYFYKLEADGFSEVKKMILVK